MSNGSSFWLYCWFCCLSIFISVQKQLKNRLWNNAMGKVSTVHVQCENIAVFVVLHSSCWVKRIFFFRMKTELGSIKIDEMSIVEFPLFISVSPFSLTIFLVAKNGCQAWNKIILEESRFRQCSLGNCFYVFETFVVFDKSSWI